MQSAEPAGELLRAGEEGKGPIPKGLIDHHKDSTPGMTGKLRAGFEQNPRTTNHPSLPGTEGCETFSAETGTALGKPRSW